MALPVDAAGPGSMTSSFSSSSTNATAGPSSASAISTLRSLYPRAAHALLQRDFTLTQTILESAFELLPPPSSLGSSSVPDSLDTHRRKWDILRITLETSAFDSPPSASSKGVSADDVLPPTLRANLMLSAPGLITALHTRSVRLFTPKQQSPKAAFLPAQILIPLVYSSLKLHCPDVGRGMIEDWLAQRDSVESTRRDLEGYERVLELYCLHVLTRLHDWEYAQEFLEYESELSDKARQSLKTKLQVFRAQEIESARSIPSPPPPSLPSSSSSSGSRTPSPSPSLESNSSSDTDDTHSTRTVVPHTPRAKHGMNGVLSPLTPTPSSSSTSLAAEAKYSNSNGHAGIKGKGRSVSPVSELSTARGSQALTERRAAGSISANGHAQHRTVGARNNEPSGLTFAMSILKTYISQVGASRLLFALLCLLVPVFSFLVRLRNRRRSQKAITGTHSGSSVDAVRRRLAGQVRGGGGGLLGSLWVEMIRAVADAVRMAGGGLV
ncbi:uncharacterized protein FOMMEDRAFT_117370 [Fomitiporia mediterranea MF3/22]|uniref:uncharacterized protein n=1 Tax=Fomitiporia mediterranea (strain MF3/22) TaxID=694068 RepID=UPI00044087B8|nr:uncharacterized protein FOMMEDRAFT_117370 [Fomitiporia mediterranea MF3/22]EJD06523.1 hypothetical protein FOMMEDRAFT_117370 [Fomitiporia mediterranea MF3/22]